MNCKQINEKILITDWLSSEGFHPSKTTGHDYYYYAPTRIEKTPSFHVNIEKNTWYDFGERNGGTLIDLATIYWKCDVKESLRRLSNFSPNSLFSSFQKPDQTEEHLPIVITKRQALQNKALVGYLVSRCIPIEIAQKHCEEIYLKVNRKNYFYIAFKNDNGGLELRNKYMKSCHGCKDITTIQKNDKFLVFEGFIDYLSSLILWPDTSVCSAIILNSVSLVHKAIDKIKAFNPESIELYLDNDKAGQAATKELTRIFSDATDRSIRFRPFKDCNDYLINKNQ